MRCLHSIRLAFPFLCLLTLALVIGCDRGSPDEASSGGASEAGESTSTPTAPTDDVSAAAETVDLTPLTTAARAGAAMSSEGAGRAGRADDPTRPLPAAVAERFAAIRNDPDPESLVRNSHYWVSNEYAQWVFEPHIRDVGGLLMGVGTDQVYLFAGWAKSSIVVPLDFDRMVTQMHHLYGFLFSRADTPEAFVAFWDETAMESTQALIAEHFADDEATRSQYQRIHRIAQEEVERRLGFIVRKFSDKGVPTFLTDQAQYDFVRQLWADGRVFPVCGDLTADVAMVDLAEAATRSGLDLRVLYLSNAEVYFEFGPSYRRNVIVQPYSEESLTLRTRQLTAYGLAAPNDYHYQVQPSRNFAGWMAFHIGKTLSLLMAHRRETEVDGFSILDEPPIRNSTPPEVASYPEWFTPPAWLAPSDGE